MRPNELIAELDRVMPDWRLEYDNKPLDAALDLCLMSHEEVEEATTYKPLNFSEPDYEQWYDADAEETDFYE